MKKRVVSYLALVAFQCINADFDRFMKPEVGFMKYNIKKAHLLDASGNHDYIKTHGSFAPLIRFSLGYEYDDLGKFRSDERTMGRFGLQVQYAKKHDGVTGQYYDEGFETPSFTTTQSINRVDILGFVEYDYATFYGIQQTVGGGLGMAKGALKSLFMYEASNGAFTGQSLKPHSVNVAGYLSYAMRKSFERTSSVTYELGYHIGIVGVRYKPEVVQMPPAPDADLAAQNAFQLLNDLAVLKAPTFTVFSQELTFGIQWDF